jgi:hypothetical protein
MTGKEAQFICDLDIDESKKNYLYLVVEFYFYLEDDIYG